MWDKGGQVRSYSSLWGTVGWRWGRENSTVSADPRLERPRKTKDRQTQHSPKLASSVCPLRTCSWWDPGCHQHPGSGEDSPSSGPAHQWATKLKTLFLPASESNDPWTEATGSWHSGGLKIGTHCPDAQGCLGPHPVQRKRPMNFPFVLGIPPKPPICPLYA